MRQKLLICGFALLVVLSMTAFNAFAQAPNTIMYQGRLTNADGAPITTATSVTFAIYATDAGGSALFTSTQSVTPDDNGIFTVELGPMNATILDGSKRYVGLKVEADAEMTPRQLLTSAPYAYSAENTTGGATGDITAVTAGSGLSGGGTTGAVTLSVATGGITATHIASSAVANAELANNAVTGAKVSNGSLADVDIADEPGIAHTFQNVNATLATSATLIDSVMITVPTSGYIVYQAAGAVELQVGATGAVKTIITLSASRTSMDYNNMTNFDLGIQAADYYYAPVSIIVVDVVPSAGTYKYYLLGTKSSGVTTAIAYRCHILATFYPTAYGATEESKSNINSNSATPTGTETGNN